MCFFLCLPPPRNLDEKSPPLQANVASKCHHNIFAQVKTKNKQEKVVHVLLVFFLLIGYTTSCHPVTCVNSTIQFKFLPLRNTLSHWWIHMSSHPVFLYRTYGMDYFLFTVLVFMRSSFNMLAGRNFCLICRAPFPCFQWPFFSAGRLRL